MSPPSTGQSQHHPVPGLLSPQGRPGFEWGREPGDLPGAGSRPPPRPDPRAQVPRRQVRRRGSGKPHLQAAGAGFPTDPNSVRRQLTSGLLPSNVAPQSTPNSPGSPQPAVSPEEGLNSNPLSSSQLGQRAGPALPSPAPAPGRSPAPTRSQQLVSPDESPHPGGPSRAARGAPEVRSARTPGDALALRALPQAEGAVRPAPRGKGTGSLSHCPGARLSSPRRGRRGAPRPPAAPPYSCVTTHLLFRG